MVNGNDASGGSKKQMLLKGHKLSFEFEKYGHIHEDGDPIPPEYLVRITSFRNKCTVIAPLQEPIALYVRSNWEPLVPTSILQPLNTVVQAATKGGRSAITSATTRRMWTGTSPMEVSLRLKFEAVGNAYDEVVEPCRLLQSMAVPSVPSTNNRGGITLPLLRPPGPPPFVWDNLLRGQTKYTEKTRSEVEESSGGGDFIMIELGTFLTFYNVIIREGGVNYDIKFTKSGYPISAQMEIRFETYEMPTKESLAEAYHITEISDSGS